MYYRLIFLSVSTFLYFSCSPEKVSNPVLLRADSLMECCADSALLLLQNIERPHEMSKAEQFYYALLLTQAKDKNYIEHTSDSLMKSVVEYYKQYGTILQKMKSLYYLASVYRDLGDAPQALDYFQQAADASKEKTEHELLSRIYSQMGTLYFYQKLNKEGSEAYKKSYCHTQMSGDSLLMVHGLNKLARIYTEQSNEDSVLYYYKEAIGLAKRIGKDGVVRGLQSELVSIYLQLNEIEEVRALLINHENNGIDFLNWGELYMQSGEIDSSKHYYLKASETGGLYVKRTANKSLYQLAKLQRQPEETIYYLEQYVLLEDSIRSSMDADGVKRIESLYAYQHIKNENNQLLLKSERRKYLIYIVWSITFMLVGVGCWMFLSYRRRKNSQFEQSMRIFFFKQQESQTEIANKNERIIELKEKLENTASKNVQEVAILKQQLDEVIRKQSDLLTQKQQSEKSFRSSLTYQQLQENLKDPRFKMKEHWTELQEQIDATYSNFTSRLYMIYPRLSETELHVCLLIKAGIPLKEIANLLYKGKSSISNIRKRLYEKTHGKTGKAEQWDEFISNM